MMDHHYFVYIVSNPKKTVLYTGVTNDLERRMLEHYENRGKKETFAGKYFCYKRNYILKLSMISGKRLKEKRKSKTWAGRRRKT